MDGNRRWAKSRGVPMLEGHRAGVEALKEAVRFLRNQGVRHIAPYAFSTENWNRSADEVSHLLTLFTALLEKDVAELGAEGFRIRFAGQRERFSPKIQKLMLRAEKDTSSNTAATIWICVSYGGRAEIVVAARAAGETGAITEESLSHNLWTSDMPDPDVIIRTGGEKRLSGFLAWQSVYSELFFSDTLWPDFSNEELGAILVEFASRERRHGK
jgi:undecaprenyl diphosphate synthase